MGRSLGALALAGFCLISACIVSSGGGGGGWSVGVTDGGTPGTPPVDPRPPAERACPTGATLVVRLHRVYATPRRPDGDVWDGVSLGTQELICRVASVVIRRAVREGLNMWAPGSGQTLDRWVGGVFQQQVAQQCGVALSWLQMRYEGPDMFAVGISDDSAAWQTPAEQDTWAAPRAAGSAWTQAVWRVPCGDDRTVMRFNVVDEDFALNDDVEQGPPFTAASIGPRAICGGWGWIDGASGLVGSLLQLQVEGGNPSCVGLSPQQFEDFVIHRDDGTIPMSTPAGEATGRSGSSSAVGAGEGLAVPAQ